jgi:hypothetical protein
MGFVTTFKCCDTDHYTGSPFYDHSASLSGIFAGVGVFHHLLRNLRDEKRTWGWLGTSHLESSPAIAVDRDGFRVDYFYWFIELIFIIHKILVPSSKFILAFIPTREIETTTSIFTLRC